MSSEARDLTELHAQLFNYVTGSGAEDLNEALIREYPEVLDKEDVDGMGNSYLLAAIAKNQTDRAIKIISLSNSDQLAKKDSAEFCSNTPLLLALKKGNIAVAHALIQADCHLVHCKDLQGLSPLHWAAILRDETLIRALLDAGAQDYYSNQLGDQPGMLAKDLYAQEFTEDDVKLKDDGGGPDSAGYYHLHRNILTDLFWHAYDMSKNLGFKKNVDQLLRAKLPATVLNELNLDEFYPTVPVGRLLSNLSRQTFIDHRQGLEVNPNLLTLLSAARQKKKDSAPEPSQNEASEAPAASESAIKTQYNR